MRFYRFARGRHATVAKPDILAVRGVRAILSAEAIAPVGIDDAKPLDYNHQDTLVATVIPSLALCDILEKMQDVCTRPVIEASIIPFRYCAGHDRHERADKL